MTPADLSSTVLCAVRRAVDGGTLAGPVPDSVPLARPGPGGSGDYATSVALRLAGPARRSPRDVAEILRTEILRAAPGLTRVDVTGPGFLNFTLAPGSGAGLVRDVLGAGLRYGHGDALAGRTVVLPPAGDIRAAVRTGAVLRLLRAQGADARTGAGATERLPVRPVPPALAGDLLARLGRDAAHWGLLRPAAHERAATGDDLLVQHASNPLFTVRYAHARSRALLRNGADLGVPTGRNTGRNTRHDTDHDAVGDDATGPDTGPDDATGTYGPGARALLDSIGDHPGVLAAAARHRAPDRVARHLERTAEAFLHFQETCRPLPAGDEKPSAAHRSRLALAEAAGTVLAGGLTLLGIDAPAHL
ncbi:DALR anticodon-binding domain-containing protein [Streptomyces sp. NBC_01498]|uniref:ArgS-related anticodon-binding protein NrtL n=1 Tax=Streptomyces sp. NBC_01498 TaxID=2975870 RepID=UPI002E7BEE7F|nr:DALR anticodon-binding domain-containing protein [Streptomyces sp. NBC_01498]WTL24649.1 DALR anticodon-binding domain-containing protein [Streptomyces sp. NBC_01498]